MVFDYFDMLSGRPLALGGVGHIRSPYLHELVLGDDGMPRKAMYNAYLGVLSWDREAVLKYMKDKQFRGVDKMERSTLSVFDIATLWPRTRELFNEALSFFIVERVAWDEDGRYFTVTNDDEFIVGTVSRENFDEVRRAILQMNYIGLDKEASPIKHSSGASKELWEKAQKHLKDLAKNDAGKDKPEYHLSNIVSKVCAAHHSYNLFNIYNLTIFQLYDTFFQIGYLRSSNLSERIFSNHGGEKFKFENWLKPIFKNM